MASVPDVVIGEPAIEKPKGTVCETLVTVPLPAQVPFLVRKQPESSWIPFANVLVAVEEALSPPERRRSPLNSEA